jgi:hypothetical protein
MRKFFLAVAIFFLTSALRIATAQTATPVPDMKPDLSPEMYLVGTWTCHSQNPNRPGDRIETDTWRLSLDGRFLQAHTESPSFDKMRTRAITEEYYKTYDPVVKKWVWMSFDNFGNYGMSTSPGYNGNTIVWTETVSSGGNPLGTSTITKNGDTKMSFVYVAPAAKGTSKITGTCTKA